MKINTNVAALNAQRILGSTSAKAADQIGKLSSGFRINSAKDDAAGLGIANKLHAETRALQQASRNADQANSMLQIMEGGASKIGDILQRMKELATQGASDNTSDAGRTSIVSEYNQLQNEIDRIVSTTKFQGGLLLKSTTGSASVTENISSASSVVADGATVSTDTSGLPTTVSFIVDTTKAIDGTYAITQLDATHLRMQRNDGTFQDKTVAANPGTVQTINFDELGVRLNLDTTYNSGAAATSFADNGADTFTLDVTAGSGGAREFLVSSSGSYTSDDLINLSGINLQASAAGMSVDTTSQDTSGTVTRDQFQTWLTTLDTAIDTVNTALGSIGAAQNRIQFASDNVKTTIQNFAAAESTIRDADMAAEMTEFTKQQILQQAGVAMLSQANSAPQMVLKLLG